MDAIEYDEEAELDKYVLNYSPNLMTELESLVQKAACVEEKAENATTQKMASKLRDKWGSQDDPEVVAALSKGVATFKRTVRNRILSEHSDEIFLNKCPECNRLVKTPRAKLCLWCNHSWHKSS